MIAYFLVSSLFTAGFFASPALAASCPNENGIMGFPAWYKGLPCKTVNGSPVVDTSNMKIEKVWIVVLNILQWLIVAAGYIALYFIIWSGFRYILAQGQADQIKTAKNTLTNAVIGLVIVLISVGIVRTIQAAVINGRLL